MGSERRISEGRKMPMATEPRRRGKRMVKGQ